MSHAAPLGPPRTSHPHPPAPSRPVLQTTGAAPIRGGLRQLSARLLAEQIERMSRADARLERLLAAGLREATVRGIARSGGPQALQEPAMPPPGGLPRTPSLRPAWPRAEDFARTLGLESEVVRELIRFDRALAALPRIAAAYDAGLLPRAKLLALLPLATCETEEIWLARAARYTAPGLGAIGAAAGGGVARAVVAASGPRPAPPAGDEFPIWMNATAVVREALRPLGPDTDPAALAAGRIGTPPAGPGAAVTLFDAVGAGAPAIRGEARLRHLVVLRQSVEWRLGRLLAALRRHSLHLDLGSRSIEEWAAAGPGLEPRRVGELLGIDRALASLPATAEAWRRGRITWLQARLVARAADARSERHWLRLATQIRPERLAALVVAAQATATSVTEAALVPRPVGPRAARKSENVILSAPRRRAHAE